MRMNGKVSQKILIHEKVTGSARRARAQAQQPRGRTGGTVLVSLTKLREERVRTEGERGRGGEPRGRGVTLTTETLQQRRLLYFWRFLQQTLGPAELAPHPDPCWFSDRRLEDRENERELSLWCRPSTHRADIRGISAAQTKEEGGVERAHAVCFLGVK